MINSRTKKLCFGNNLLIDRKITLKKLGFSMNLNSEQCFPMRVGVGIYEKIMLGFSPSSWSICGPFGNGTRTFLLHPCFPTELKFSKAMVCVVGS